MGYRNRHAWRDANRGKLREHRCHPRDAWRICGHHQYSYHTYRRLEDGHYVSAECPRCVEDRKWAVAAYRELLAEGIEPTNERIVERGEKLAGHQLWRYNHG